MVVKGRALGNMTAMEYHRRKGELRALVGAAYEELAAGVDYVILEGAGSPAEINLREGDLSLIHIWSPHLSIMCLHIIAFPLKKRPWAAG